MNDIKNEVQKICELNLSNYAVGQYRSLITFIDSSLSEAYKKEGDERVSSLVTCLLNIRDYLFKEIVENGFKQVLGNNILNSIDNIQRPKDDEKKKEEASLEENKILEKE